ncbi:MAG: homoserine O-succinyltransferase, partial [Lachnospiraceae bacterium]|nr:homoserine O-succinyltransferase [Lachnospiraceae bacterium]
MPIKIQKDLPAKGILENENIFVMDEGRAVHQDIRPIRVCILNLMPVKQDTELQLLRALSNTPLQVEVTFLTVKSHTSQNTSANHLNKFYTTMDEIHDNRYDGMIITGAPVEDITFEEVDYWQELCEIMDWSGKHVTSTLHICWGAQAAFYHHYHIQKKQLPE